MNFHKTDNEQAAVNVALKMISVFCESQAAEIVALKEQMAANELSWDNEKQTIIRVLTDKQKSQIAEWKIKLTALEDRMRSELAANEESFQREQELQRESRQMEEWRNQKEEEIKLLTQQNADLQEHNISLRELTKQTDKEKEQFKKEQEKLKLTILNLESYASQKESDLLWEEAEWKIERTALEDRMRSKHADLQADNLRLQVRAKQTDKEKEQFKKEQEKLKLTILSLESYARQTESDLLWGENEWKIKRRDLEDRMRSKHADLQADNLRLQVLAKQTDKEKAQIKKEEKKARKEAENTLKKERKEEDKREKKEKKEKEKREKEKLKRQKKKRKENENRHQGELKRQKKEKELMENKNKGGK